ncbi:uncharacterized protein TNCT_493201 [Trichonephila clavata]|uniref:DUF389 domain-containing protein n=1 Tax=Trichonephila clavata TaxID=2740835 RepID=A0A8X6GKX7_TRICU|nr:uncharacterized protein TNCT_493201 [Trichonephila clavata]
MSYGGGGLCFLIRVPTVEYEKDVYDPRFRSTPATTPESPNGNGVPIIQISSDSVKLDESTEVKTRISDPLEQVLRKSLEELRIYDALWVLDKDEKFYQVSFTCNAGLPCDLVLTALATSGIGMCKGSSLVVLPCTVWLQEEDDSTQSSREQEQKLQFIVDEEKKSDSDLSTLSKTKSEVKKAFRNFKDMQKKFLQTVTARLTVAQVVDGVRAGAEPTFDFIMFVLLASMIAALGLLENSSVIIVASMLISPIMGPIMAGTFGAVIRDKPLRNLGIKTEIVGLCLCMFIGFTFGLLSEALNAVWGSKEWPNSEMISRGQERSLWVGVLIALPSGAGVALSILGGNAGCLVGVAISASLLPPAVNAGILWGMAMVRTLRAQEEQYEYLRVDGLLRLFKPSLMPPMNYEWNYYPEMDKECALLGLVSLALALVNIVCIFLSALVVLKIKEVAPRTSVAKTSRFWKEDIRIARDYNTTMPAAEADELGKQFLAEWATLNGLEPDALLGDDAEAALTRMETLKDIMQDVETDEVFQTIARSVSSVSNPRVAANQLFPISQRLSVMSVPPNMAATKSSPIAEHKDAQRDRSKSVNPVLNGQSDITLDPEFKDIELRRPQVHISPRLTQRHSTARSSVAVLRQSLLNADSPYTLWPSESGNKNRFRVTPVPEETLMTVPTSPVRRRISRFLQDPCVIMKETTC